MVTPISSTYGAAMDTPPFVTAETPSMSHIHDSMGEYSMDSPTYTPDSLAYAESLSCMQLGSAGSQKAQHSQPRVCSRSPNLRISARLQNDSVDGRLGEHLALNRHQNQARLVSKIRNVRTERGNAPVPHKTLDFT